jgi:hypothetical protein
MAPDIHAPGGRARRYYSNPEFQVFSPPGAKLVCLTIELGSDSITGDFDRVHAEALRRELDVAISLLDVKPYQRAKTSAEQAMGVPHV